MIDYKELVEELRSKHIEDRYKRLTLDAAEAIEELLRTRTNELNCAWQQGYDEAMMGRNEHE